MHIGEKDGLMAATALRYHLTLLTNNRRRFDRVEGLDITSL
jgi:predicted nucleic acid-binding protein